MAAARRHAVGGDDAFLFPYGVMSPAQRFAMKVTRFMHENGIDRKRYGPSRSPVITTRKTTRTR